MASKAATKDKKITTSSSTRKPASATTTTVQQKKTTNPVSTKKTTSLPSNETKKVLSNQTTKKQPSPARGRTSSVRSPSPNVKDRLRSPSPKVTDRLLRSPSPKVPDRTLRSPSPNIKEKTTKTSTSLSLKTPHLAPKRKEIVKSPPLPKPGTKRSPTSVKKESSINGSSNKKLTKQPTRLAPKSKPKADQNDMNTGQDSEKSYHGDESDPEIGDGEETIYSKQSPVALEPEVSSQCNETVDEQEMRNQQDKSELETEKIEAEHKPGVAQDSELNLVVEPEPEPQPELEPETEVEHKLESKPDPESEQETEEEHKPELDQDSAAEPNLEVEHKPESILELELEPEPEVEYKPEKTIEPELEPEPKVEQKPGSKPGPEPEVEYELVPEPKLEAELEPKLEMENKLENNLEPESESKPEMKYKPEPKLEPEMDPKLEPKQKPNIGLIASRNLEPNVAQENGEPKEKVKEEVVLEENKKEDCGGKVAKSRDTAAQAVAVKSHVGVGLDKKDNTAYNNVIEETVIRLREKKKTKVSALVGAFETVISLESD